MSFASNMALKYIKTQKKHSIFIILSIVSALAFVTVIFTLFSSFYSSMLNIEKSKYDWHALVHGIEKTDADSLCETDMIVGMEFLPYRENSTDGVAYLNFSPDVFDPETYIREFSENNFINKDITIDLHDALLEYELIGIHAKAALVQKLAIVYVFVMFIIFFARFVIDTAFEISSKEREVQFGILASLGASKKQITSILLWQGTFLSVIGIPLGLLLGIGAGYLIYSVTESIGIFQLLTGFDGAEGVFSASPLFIILAAVTGFIWVLLSAYGTGKRFSKRSPIQSIKQSGKKVFKVKKSLFFGKWFGFSGDLASKNIRREKKSFIITAFALSLSFTIISLFSVFVDYYNKGLREMEKGQQMLSENIADDYAASYFGTMTEDGSFISDIKEGYRILENSLDGVYVNYISHLCCNVTKDSYMLREKIPFDKNFLSVTKDNAIILDFVFLNKRYYDEIFRESSGIDYDTLAREKGFIVCETYMPIDGFEGSPIKAGSESFSISLSDDISLMEGGSKVVFKDANIKVMGSAQSVNSFSTYSSMITFIGTEDHFFELNGGSIIKSDEHIRYMIGLPRNNGKSLGKMDDEIREYLKDYPEVYLYGEHNLDNIIKMEKQFSSVFILIISVIVLVSLIAIINQVNIISTGIINRRKEIASLRALGMTGGQLFKMLALESVGYVAIATVVSAIISAVIIVLTNMTLVAQIPGNISLSVITAVITTAICAVVGFIIGMATIMICTADFNKNSIAEEMKTIE